MNKIIITQQQYDDALTSTAKSRWLLDIAAAYINFSLHSYDEIIELKEHPERMTPYKEALLFSTIMMLAFAFEIAMKAKLDDDILQQLNIPGIRDNREGHNLEKLFGKLPKAEQEQLKINVTQTVLINEQVFDGLLHYFHNAFQECRYFFEDEYAVQRKNYLNNCFLIIKTFYSSAYYFISSEGRDDCLEYTPLKEMAYLGEGGFYYRKYKIEKELIEARETAQKDGNGTISDSDMNWIKGIEERLAAANKDMEECRDKFRVKEGQNM